VDLAARRTAHHHSQVDHRREDPHLHDEVVLSKMGEVRFKRLLKRVPALSARRAVLTTQRRVLVGVEDARALVLVADVAQPVNEAMELGGVKQSGETPLRDTGELSRRVERDDVGQEGEPLNQGGQRVLGAFGLVQEVKARKKAERAKEVLNARHKNIRRNVGVPAVVGPQHAVELPLQRVGAGGRLGRPIRVDLVRLCVCDDGPHGVQVREDVAGSSLERLRDSPLDGKAAAAQHRRWQNGGGLHGRLRVVLLH